MKSTKTLVGLLVILFVTLSLDSNAQTVENNSWWDTFKSYFISDTPTNQKQSETLKDRTGGTVKTPTTVKDNPESIKDRPGSVNDKPAPVKTPTTVKNPESIKDRPGSVKDRPAPVKTPTTVKGPVKDRPTTTEPVKDRPTQVNTVGSGKAKCGVPGCQHPGKHEGLHKHQAVVAPIRYEKGKGKYKVHEKEQGQKAHKNNKHEFKAKGKNKGKKK